MKKSLIDNRIHGSISAFNSTIITLTELSQASNLQPEDKKLLLLLIDRLDSDQSAMVGTFLRMRSLTAKAKKQILSNFEDKLAEKTE